MTNCPFCACVVSSLFHYTNFIQSSGTVVLLHTKCEMKGVSQTEKDIIAVCVAIRSLPPVYCSPGNNTLPSHFKAYK